MRIGAAHLVSRLMHDCVHNTGFAPVLFFYLIHRLFHLFATHNTKTARVGGFFVFSTIL